LAMGAVVRIAQSRRMRLLPIDSGKAAGTRAPERASRAIPALSPLIIRCPPLTPAKIRRAFRWVNGITRKPSGSRSPLRPVPRPASCDPREPQHIVSVVMGCSCWTAAPCGASAFSRSRRRKGSRRPKPGFSPASASDSLSTFRSSGFDFPVNLFAILCDQASGARRLQRP
jgi:hypothetical protein